MTIQVQAQINGGAQQTGAVTVAAADVVQFSLVSAAGVGSLLWEIYSHPTDEAGAGFGLSLPSGWTVGADGHSYFYVGTTPPTVTIPAAPYWGKILVRCTPGGDALAADDSLVLTMLSPTLGLEDIAPLEESQADAYRAWGKAIQNDLRIMEDAIAGAGAGTPYASTPAAVGSSGKAGSSSDYARGDHVHAGVSTLAQAGKGALTGAVTLSAGANVTLTQAGQDISIAASGSAGGPPAAITWDTTQATDSAVGRYQTWAEVRTAANSTEAPMAVYLVGSPTTSGTSTDDWPHVTWYSNDTGVTLTFTEGVVVKNSRFDVAGDVTSTATTTTNLVYAPGSAAEFRGQFSASTKGLIGVDGAGSATFRLADGSIVGAKAFHTAASQTISVYAGATDFKVGVGDHIEGSAGNANVFRSNETTGDVSVSSYSGTFSETDAPNIVSRRPATDAHDLVVFTLQDPSGATSISNSGAGTAFTLPTLSGAGQWAFGAPSPLGDCAFLSDVKYFTGGGDTYQPSVTNITTSCWAFFHKSPNLGSAGFVSLFGKLNATDSTIALGVDTNAGELRAKVGAGGVDTSVTSLAAFPGEWYHLALTYDGATATFYINGLPKAVAKTGTLDWDNTKSWIVGNAGTAGVNMLVADCRIADVCRSALEIKDAYLLGIGGKAAWQAASNDADSLKGVVISATAPTTGKVLTATGAAAAEWATPSVTEISGVTVSGTPAVGQVLKATSGSAASWADVDKVGGVTVSGTPTAGQVLAATSGSAASWAAEKLGGRAVSTSAPSDGHGLKYNNGSSQWEPAAINAAAVTGLTVSGTAVDGMILTATSGVAASWRSPALLYSAADLVASKSAAAVGAANITAGQQFEVTDNFYCDGIRFRWASSSGTPTCTIELWDDAGAVLKSATQAVTTTPTTYAVTFGSPQDLTSYKGKVLTVSVWQQTGGEYYSVIGTCYVPNIATLIGGGVYSHGSVYCSTGHGYQDTQTVAETYGVDPILRRK